VSFGAVKVHSDSLRATLDSVFADPAYRWVERPHPLAFLARWWDALTAWLNGLQSLHPDVFFALMAGLIAVLVAIFVHAVWVMALTMRAARAPAEGTRGPVPAAVRGAAWYRSEADRLALDGRYVEAIQADFLALVLELDARQVLRYHPSKTPNEYSYETGLPPEARGPFRDLVGLLYGYAFARRPCGAADFAAWRSQAVAGRYAAAH
jgi:Domain of unknown function (DUF4129)